MFGIPTFIPPPAPVGPLPRRNDEGRFVCQACSKAQDPANDERLVRDHWGKRWLCRDCYRDFDRLRKEQEAEEAAKRVRKWGPK
jgi:hypothetical protein